MIKSLLNTKLITFALNSILFPCDKTVMEMDCFMYYTINGLLDTAVTQRMEETTEI